MLTGRDSDHLGAAEELGSVEPPGSVHLGRADPGQSLQLMLMQDHSLTLVPKESQRKVAATARYGICFRLAYAQWPLLPISKCWYLGLNPGPLISAYTQFLSDLIQRQGPKSILSVEDCVFQSWPQQWCLHPLCSSTMWSSHSFHGEKGRYQPPSHPTLNPGRL